MTGYAAIHFSLATTCVLMAAVHAILATLSREDRAQAWLAASYLGFAAMLSSIGSAGTAGTPLVPPRVALLAGVVAIPLYSAILETTWALFGREVRGARRVVRYTLGAIVAARTLEVLVLWRRDAFSSWEELISTGSLALPMHLCGFAIAAVWAQESVLALRRAPAIAIASMLTAAIALPFFALEIPRILGTPVGPTWFGFTSLPILALGSVAVISNYVRAVRRIERIGGYRLLRPLSSGGMGDVFVAVRSGPMGFERQVALKRIRARTTEKNAIERFLVEARIAARLSHPNVIAIHDLGETNEGWFIAMELLDGRDLAEVRRAAAPVPSEILAAIGEQACRGLAAAHTAGIVHRDVSPQNVMVTFDGIVKVVDFGIAKPIEGAELPAPADCPLATGDGLTEAGTVVGKRGYLSPEQLVGEGATPASDLWALGVVLYELATDTRPYRLPAAASSLPHPDLWRPAAALRADLPHAIDAILTRALSWSAAQRWPNAAAMADAFHAAGTASTTDLSLWMRAHFTAPPAPGTGGTETLAPTAALPTAHVREDRR